MSSYFKTNFRGSTGLGIHAGGRADYREACAESRLHNEEAKLERRIEYFCHPANVSGYIFLAVNKRRLLRKLKARFDVPYAMFVSDGSVIGRALSKTIIPRLRRPKKKHNKAEMATPNPPSDRI